MDICLESFNPYAINEEEVINEGTNIFTKALEVLSKIWHKILDTITGFLNKFKKKSKNTTAAQFKKTCKDKNITEINVPVIKNLGKMFKSPDALMDWVESVGEGLDLVARYLSSPGGDGKQINRINEMKNDLIKWYRHFSAYETTGDNIETPEYVLKGIRTAMVKDCEGGPIKVVDTENILSWSGTGYSLEQIFDDDAMSKLRTSITKHASLVDGLSYKMKKFVINVTKKSRESLRVLQNALKVVLEINREVGTIVDKYIWTIATIRNKALTIMASSGTKKNVSECFAYIR